MGLDQYLNIVITTDEKTANRNHINSVAEQLTELIHDDSFANPYSFASLYSPVYIDENDMTSKFDLDPIYNIDGYATQRYELLTVKGCERSYRKANQIQNYFETWFYEGGNEADTEEYNCVNTKVDDLTIDDLLNRIHKINKNPTAKVAKAEFPTTVGFFYGDTDYDEFYFEQNNEFANDLIELKQIRDQINSQLANTPYQAIIEYSSWW